MHERLYIPHWHHHPQQGQGERGRERSGGKGGVDREAEGVSSYLIHGEGDAVRLGR